MADVAAEPAARSFRCTDRVGGARATMWRTCLWALDGRTVRAASESARLLLKTPAAAARAAHLCPSGHR
eukprot:1277332-Pyramimonas_sp.AAC.1